MQLFHTACFCCDFHSDFLLAVLVVNTVEFGMCFGQKFNSCYMQFISTILILSQRLVCTFVCSLDNFTYLLPFCYFLAHDHPDQLNNSPYSCTWSSNNPFIHACIFGIFILLKLIVKNQGQLTFFYVLLVVVMKIPEDILLDYKVLVMLNVHDSAIFFILLTFLQSALLVVMFVYFSKKDLSQSIVG